jgi:hypothetical protein
MIAAAAAQLLSSSEEHARQKNDAKTALAQLVPQGPQTPSQRAAHTILGLLK